MIVTDCLAAVAHIAAVLLSGKSIYKDKYLL